ncbi:MAG TPA: thioredoxin family protein [Caulobacteraceae bacterium]|jgi:thiol:disulfide interchange protein|nr:thioredoxin family protein [Caulobacteraceae bacterium]
MKRALLSLALIAGLAAAPALAAPAPKVTSVATLKDLPTPLPLPYDEAADARTVNARLDAAIAQARRSHRLLLVDLGGNWCPDCRLLAAVMRLPEVKAFVDQHYVVLPVDIGRRDKNLQVPHRFGLDKIGGVPSLIVVDRKGRIVDDGHVEALADARSMTPQALADWLAQWTN